ncbi:MAG: HTH domain-containing protein [Spirosomataceae bacterium]|jgi:biotin operon repressor
MDTKEIVFETLKKSSEPLKCGQIADLTGIDKTIVDKAIKALRKEEKVISPKNCFYAAV